jgi:predicted nucleotidyltransferase
MTEVRTTNKLPPIVQRHLSEIVELARIHGVERLEVFGSVMTDHHDPLTSDIDFLVSFKQASRTSRRARTRNFDGIWRCRMICASL